jgi:hypothetical protein
MFAVKSGTNLEIFAVFFGTGDICKFINRTFDFTQPPLYNISAKEVFTMTDTLFEQLGGTYTQQGDYLLPNLALPAEKETGNIGVWALRHKRYIKQHHKVLYYNLLTSGKLDSYLADIEEQAQQLFLRLVKELAEKEGVTEQLKAADQMAWVRRMNNTRSRATEIVVKEINCI